MRIIVFGATGGTGKEVVRQALDAGHEVTAVARDPSRLGLEAPRLRVERLDAAGDPARVAAVIAGHDAVVSALGAPGMSTAPVREMGTRLQIAGMREAGVRRLVSVSSIGVGDSAGVLPLWMRYLVVPVFLRRAFADHARQEGLLQEASDLDWIVVRPSGLTDGPGTGDYHHGFRSFPKGAKGQISRADVADFVLRQLDDDTYLRKCVAITR